MSPIAKPQAPPINSTRKAIHKQVEIGRILTVAADKALVSVNKTVIRNNQLHMVQLGTILKIVTRESIVVAMVSSLKVGAADSEGLHDGCLAQLDILGEITTNVTTRKTRFFRGVRTFPVLNEPVYNMSLAELEIIFNKENEPVIEIGTLHQDPSIVAKVRIDDLLSKHFAIIGSTGSGKSCTVALVMQAILKENRNAHVVLFDPHNEYSKSFGNMAEVIRSDTLDLPLWMFNFEEISELLTSEIEDQAREEQEILHDVILKAKRLFERSRQAGNVSAQVKIEDVEKDLMRAGSHISLDSPVPFRIRDVLKLINHQMGKLENSNNLSPYKRLNRRIETLLGDQRYQFAFKNQAAPTSIGDIIGKIFRIPVQGRPIAILDFSGIPSETLNIVVSVVSRLAFDLAMWSERKIPILLVCEEAHRYIPSNPNLGFNSTRRSISRIAKEGRKYGVSLAIVSQRPSELEPSTLSQCSTIFSMRLSNEVDQDFVKAAVPDGAAELLAFLPSLGTAEAMVFGESVNMPMRVVLNRLNESQLPHSSSAKFTDLWAHDINDPAFMNRVFENWRTRNLQIDPEISEELYAHRGAPAPRHAATGVARSLAAQSERRTSQIDRRALERRHVESGVSRDQLRKALKPNVNSAGMRKQSLSDVKKILNGAFHRDS